MTTADDDQTAQLMAIATGGSEADRIALAKNPDAPENVIAVLAQDRSFLVGEHALRRLKAGQVDESGRPGSGSATGETVESTARRALSVVDNLNFANSAVVVLSLLGAAFLVYLGAQSVCFDGTTDCFPSDRRNNPVLIVMGVALAAAAVWIYFIAKAIGVRIELAARQAQETSP